MIELSPKINEALDEYHGFFKSRDNVYKKMNPIINVGNEYKYKIIIKTFFWFNKKSFDKTIGAYIKEIEIILNNINRKKFAKDKEETIRMFNYICK